MSSELLNIIIAFIAGVGGAGGGLIAYLKFFSDTSNQSRQNKLTFDEAELGKYKGGYADLQRQVDALNLALIPSPSPEWKKDSKRRYVYVSPSYEIGVLLPLGLSASDVIGKTDADIFVEYPEFVKVLEDIDDEAQRGSDHLAIRHGVYFPKNSRQMMVIKEIAQNVKRDTFYVGRSYPDSLDGVDLDKVCLRQNTRIGQRLP